MLRTDWKLTKRRQIGRLFEKLETRDLLANLVAHWTADRIAGEDGTVVASWLDEVQGIPAIAKGAPTLTRSEVGGRSLLRFQPTDGDDWLEVSQADNPLAGAGDFSILVAFATSSAATKGDTGPWFQNTGLVDANNLGFNEDWGITLNRAGQVAAGVGGGFSQPSHTLYSTRSGWNDGQLHVIAFSRANTVLSLSVDGATADVLPNVSSASRARTGFALGALYSGGGAYEGYLADVRLYTGALTQSEIGQLAAEIRSYYSNTAPQPADDHYKIEEDAAILFVPASSGVLANDHDADGDSLTALLVDPPSHGSVVLQPDGAVLYDPDPDYFGTDQFSYRAVDSRPSQQTATVTIEVLPTYDPAVPKPDEYPGLPQQILQVDATRGVLANDLNPDQVILQAVLERNVTSGQLNLHPDGSFDYDPQGFSGTVTFTYRIDDGTGRSAPANVTLVLTDQPVVISEFMASNADSLTTRLRTSPSDPFQGEVLSPDWLELRNVTRQTVPVGGLHLTDDERNPMLWRIPDGTTIPPEGHLVVFLSGKDIEDPARDERGYLHANFQLDVQGEYLALTDNQGHVIHELGRDYPPQRTNISFGFDDQGLGRYFINPTPGGANSEGLSGLVADTQFSVDRGFYDQPIELQLSTSTEGAVIRVTTDGSVPTETNGTTYTGSIRIDRTTTVRAAAFKPGLVPTNTDTHTYFFLQDIVRQDSQATLDAGFPARWRGTTPDYGFDSPDQLPLIAGDSSLSADEAQQVLARSLEALPSLSLVMNSDDMFGDRGIYSNPTNSGPAWERPTSVELIYPDGTSGFQIDAGIRIQGGAFRNWGLTKKKSLRLMFKSKYGPAKLEYPLFGPDAATEFDTLTLRMEANDGWQWGDAGGQPQYTRDEFMRRTQLATGQPAPHGTHMHVYINGIYWGLYNVVERPDASFGAAYFDSEPYAWDGLNSGNPTNASGDSFRSRRSRDAWNSMARLARELRNATTEADRTAALMRLVGLNADGTDNPQWENYLDLENYIDYLIVNWYGDNSDWPFKNYYVGRENSPDSTGFKFFTWDAEWSLLLRSSVTGNKINDASGVAEPFGSLRRSKEFQVLFGDRVHKHLFNGGALYVDPQNPQWDPDHPERNVPAARYVEIANAVYDALVAESARWGDQHRTRPYTRDVEWQREFDRLMTQWFPRRSAVLLEQLKNAGLYPRVEAASFNQRGGPVPRDFQVVLSAPAGTIYYTLDGTDPRMIGGAISPTAMPYNQPLRLTGDTTVTVRVRSGDDWSAIDEAAFRVDVVPADSTNLRFAEVHYHPAAPGAAEIAAGFDDPDDFEFIELVNAGDATVDLSDVRLQQVVVNGATEGVQFDFATAPIRRLMPGQRVVVVEDIAAFRFRYGDGLPVAGQWSGGLNNRSETLQLVRGQTVLQQFVYQDSWYPTTDGRGWSLEMVDIAAADLSLWSRAEGWRPSAQYGGSPGSPRVSQVPGDANGDGVFNSSDLVLVFQAGEYEDATQGNSTFAEGDWNGDGDFNTKDLILAFQFGGYVQQAPAAAALDSWEEATDALFAVFGSPGSKTESLLFVATMVSNRPSSAHPSNY